jgi:hypothetical protein
MKQPQLERQWKTITERHDAAVEAFLAAARDLAPVRWHAPIADGKWTPAQITQHVIQTYEVLIRQLRTGQGLTVQTGWVLRQVLRVVVLRPIMWFRRLPPGAKAPRDLRPGQRQIEQDEAVVRLRGVVAEFKRELMTRRGEKDLQLTHHIFGSVDALNGLDFVAVHTEHHGRQLSGQVTAGKC